MDLNSLHIFALSFINLKFGDPLGPLLISLALAINDTISGCKSDFKMWQFDDGVKKRVLTVL